MSAQPATTSGEAAAADFARRFAEYWREPKPEALDTVLAPNVRMVAPMTPVTHTLEEGLATERVTYFDSAPIVLAAIGRPGIWPAFLRSRLRRLRR